MGLRIWLYLVLGGGLVVVVAVGPRRPLPALSSVRALELQSL